MPYASMHEHVCHELPVCMAIDNRGGNKREREHKTRGNHICEKINNDISDNKNRCSIAVCISEFPVYYAVHHRNIVSESSYSQIPAFVNIVKCRIFTVCKNFTQ